MAHEELRVLVFAASLRGESLNAKLAELAARTAEEAGAIVDRATLREFDTPSYDGDEESDGFLRARMSSAAGSRPTTPSSSRRPSTTHRCAACSRT